MSEYQDVTLSSIGNAEDDIGLIDQTSEAIRRVCQLVDSPDFDDKGTITLQVKIRRIEDTGEILIAGSVRVAEPARLTSPVRARVTRTGRVVAQMEMFEGVRDGEELAQVSGL